VSHIEQVKINAAYYLSKYMSKGGKITADIIDVGRSYFLPSASYGDNILVMETAKAELPHKRGLGGRRPTKYGVKT
jgi:hypothetical protein